MGDTITNASVSGVGQATTLAERLRSGPWTLSFALRCATEVASGLCMLHAEGRIHGSVRPESILISADEARLVPSGGRPRYAEMAAEVAAFGALLYEMVTGNPMGHGGAAFAGTTSGGAEGIQGAAERLASRCMSTVSNSPSEMQKVLAQIRRLRTEAEWTDKEVAPASWTGNPTRSAAAAVPRPVTPDAPAVPASNYKAPADSTAVPVQVTPEIAPARDVTAPVTPFTAVEASRFLATEGAETADPARSGVACPKCGMSYAYPSRPRTWIESMLASWRCPPMRCHRCLHRFLHLFGRFNLSMGTPKMEKM